jgi:hypothetical protein
MDLRHLALAIFLTAWATLGGLLSGIVMGLFFVVYQDGYRKGVLPPQGDRPLLDLASLPTFAALTSRLSGGHR